MTTERSSKRKGALAILREIREAGEKAVAAIKVAEKLDEKESAAVEKEMAALDRQIEKLQEKRSALEEKVWDEGARADDVREKTRERLNEKIRKLSDVKLKSLNGLTARQVAALLGACGEADRVLKGKTATLSAEEAYSKLNPRNLTFLLDSIGKVDLVTQDLRYTTAVGAAATSVANKFRKEVPFDTIRGAVIEKINSMLTDPYTLEEALLPEEIVNY